MQRTFLLILLLVPESLGGLADTWDSCGCYWKDWEQWSACTATCGGGRRQRERWVHHRDAPECDKFLDCASNDMGWDYDTCGKTCFNSGTYVEYSTHLTFCNCRDGTTGKCCETSKL
ncbi:hypothetical protein DPMN_158416 [Dreissena polymorpha]|uniref:EGF-like domain-containing protein n=1 Tax=Dreissena polymorpha TaxID=45954 RepID=A0A9D4EJS2_DREPO|nr:hypothetical protein DPMN_158416 [Dreissena polymorpha]